MKPTKYRAQKIKVDGIWYASKGEYKFIDDMRKRERAGEISDLKTQVQYELVPGVHIAREGRKRPALRYVADAVYVEAGETVVADFKGVMTPAFRIKQHLMKAVHGIDILVVTA